MSTTTKDTYNFPAGICTGYYVWGIELGGRTLFLGAGIKSLENKILAGLDSEVKSLESRAEPMILVTGTPLPPSPPVPELNPGMTEARKELLKTLLSQGKANIYNYIDGSTYENDAMVSYWNDWDKRDKEATKANTYMHHGRFSAQVTGYVARPWNNGTWFCHMTKDGAIASGTKVDTTQTS